MLLSARLLNHCERFHGRMKAADKRIVNNALFVVPIKNKGSSIQLELTAETFLTSKKPIVPFIANESANGIPDIFPVSATASIPEAHFYKEQSVYRMSRQLN